MLIIRVSPTRVHVESGSPLPSGSTAAPEVTFRLDDYWADYALTAVFEGNDQTRYLTNLADGLPYDLPWECITEAGVVTVRVFGVNGEGRATTLPATLQVLDSGLPGAMPAPPTPTAYEQYVNAVQANADTASSAASAAEESAAAVAAAVEAIGDIPAMRAQAAAMLADAQAAAATLTQAEARIRALERLTATQDKQLTNLTALLTGYELDTVTDATLADEKIVPANALPYAALTVLGGQSAVVNGSIVHRKVDTVISQRITDTDVLTLPPSLLTLSGYGVGVNAACFNAVDFERRRFVRRIGIVDMGKLQWFSHTSTGVRLFVSYISNRAAGIEVGKRGHNANGLCEGYTPSANVPGALANKCFTLGSPVFSTGKGSIALRDDDFQGNASAFKAYVNGKILCYELDQPVETDLSDLPGVDNLLRVDPTCAVTFFADNELVAVPSTVVYSVRSGTGSSPSA